jgi:hypothetical protein
MRRRIEKEAVIAVVRHWEGDMQRDRENAVGKP